jgi:hypothetical protein
MIDPILQQLSFRGRADSVGLNVNTFTYALNTGWTQAANVVFRVRFATQETAGAATTTAPLIEFRVDSGGGFGAWTAVTDATGVRWATSAQYSNATATTKLLNGTGTFAAGQGRSDSNLAGSVSLAASGNTEHEWALLISGVPNASTVELRITNNGTAYGTYTNTPSLSVTAPAEGTADLNGSGDLVGVALTRSFGASALSGSGDLVGAGDVVVPAVLGEAALSGSGDLVGINDGGVVFQFARPVSDVNAAGWVVAPLWSKVNEEAVNDSPFISSTDGSTCEVALGTLTSPDAGDVTIYVRASKTLEVPAALRVRLVEGATVRAERLLDALSTSKATFPLTLSGAERASITNWGDLRIRLTRE